MKSRVSMNWVHWLVFNEAPGTHVAVVEGWGTASALQIRVRPTAYTENATDATPLLIQKYRSSSPKAFSLCVGLLISVLSCQSMSQPAPQADTKQERQAGVYPQKHSSAEHIPAESNCVVLKQLSVKAAPGDINSASGNWGWALDAVAGQTKDDPPFRRCIGVQGINLLISRVQGAISSRGFSTTRVLVKPQDLSNEALTLLVIPGRIQAIRFPESIDPGETTKRSVTVKPGDILNLRDIEQSLENLRRVRTKDANIHIVPTTVPNSNTGDSDLVLVYK